MKKINKRNKGITLVALVITIVILLILAGISIAQLTGNGLFENAKLAKESAEKAKNDEDTILTDYEDTINSYIDSNREINISSDLVASQVFGARPDNPVVNLKYTFEESGYVIVNLGTRSAGPSAGTTSYNIKINNEIVMSDSLSTWAISKSWSGKVTKGQEISIYVNDTAQNAAAFAFVNLVKY